MSRKYQRFLSGFISALTLVTSELRDWRDPMAALLSWARVFVYTVYVSLYFETEKRKNRTVSIPTPWKVSTLSGVWMWTWDSMSTRKAGVLLWRKGQYIPSAVREKQVRFDLFRIEYHQTWLHRFVSSGEVYERWAYVSRKGKSRGECEGIID